MYWHPVFYFALTYFLVGAAALIYINRRSPLSSRERWVKYFIYFFIVHVLMICMLFARPVFEGLAVGIAFISGYEVINAWRNSGKTPVFLVKALSIYLALAAGFLWFAFAGTTSDLVWVYLLVITFDGFSQITGQALGRTKLMPQISPGKTVEGFAGGLFMTVLTAYISVSSGAWFDMPLPAALIAALSIGLFAFSGDILASIYKRKTGIKDFSRLIPGHGGVLDRFDSFMVAGAAVGVASALIKYYK